MSELPTPRPHLLLDAKVFPSERKTIVAVPTDDEFKGAHNFLIAPMLYARDGQAVYATEPTVKIDFVKFDKATGTWQDGIQSEQLLQVLIYRHHQLHDQVPADEADYRSFIAHLTAAKELLEKRVRERQKRGVFTTPQR